MLLQRAISISSCWGVLGFEKAGRLERGIKRGRREGEGSFLLPVFLFFLLFFFFFFFFFCNRINPARANGMQLSYYP